MSIMFSAETTEDVRVKGAKVALLPVGSLEQHGPYLPLTTDTVVACEIAKAVAERYPVQLLPPITISCSHEHAAWPGTVSISARTLYDVVTDIAASLRRSGVPYLVLVNGHGGNYVLGNIVQESHGAMALFPTAYDWADVVAKAGIETPADEDMHAGELEASILLHTHPELLQPDFRAGDHLATDRRFLLTQGMTPYTRSGVIGMPSRASGRKGELVLNGLADMFAGHWALHEGRAAGQ
ncbi:creatininase family protein [Pseudonocardiaceae bacterium YIM PH 21723]|nr:creatininase family protein [Pseudonocardiaceae bacterium YIM PH 21723]